MTASFMARRLGFKFHILYIHPLENTAALVATKIQAESGQMQIPSLFLPTCFEIDLLYVSSVSAQCVYTWICMFICMHVWYKHRYV